MRISLLKQLINRLVIQQLLLVAAALLLSTTVSAVGMGGINVVSALGQPLKADIELVAVSKIEKPSLAARLASPEAYKSAGLDYPSGNNFKFQIESHVDGEPYIKVSSGKSINDPFVTLLVELTWSSGKLSREYTFLLDPIGYAPQQPAQVEVQAVAPVVQIAASGIPAAPVESAKATEMQVAPPESVTTSIVPPEAITTAEVPLESTESTSTSAVPAVPPATAAVPAAGESKVKEMPWVL